MTDAPGNPSGDAVTAVDSALADKCESSGSDSPSTGLLIVNADDWGRDTETTDRILDCVLLGTVSSASGMVFMEDSERSAELARARGVDIGLHLNFTTAFSMRHCSARLLDHQQRLGRFLLRNRLARIFFHPGLVGSFDYVVAAQLDQFQRLYGVEPERIDGHHHMHQCANLLLAELMPRGALVRRSFTFEAGEKSWVNRSYRRWVDRQLKRRYQLVDCLFPLAPVEPLERLRGIIRRARHAVIELETHPVNEAEYEFLKSNAIFEKLPGLEIATGFAKCVRERAIRGKDSIHEFGKVLN